MSDLTSDRESGITQAMSWLPQSDADTEMIEPEPTTITDDYTLMAA